MAEQEIPQWAMDETTRLAQADWLCMRDAIASALIAAERKGFERGLSTASLAVAVAEAALRIMNAQSKSEIEDEDRNFHAALAAYEKGKQP